MGNLLYAIAVILLIAWAIGFFAFNIGAIIHLLLLIAAISILLNIIRGNNPVK
ncbi:MAG: lmo0937 family membrane protein [Bacteroidetes bacterium]|nr:lmo0937 family membrane protein [Bacteroidota bacterium]